jgi:hypothetical protein
MSLGVPGSCGLFSMLQDGLKYKDKDHILLTPAMKDQLFDFEYLANNLAKCPNSITELVPNHPVAVRLEKV